MTLRVWFERRFELGLPPDHFAEVLSRVAGAPPRLEELVRGAAAEALSRHPSDGWSAQEHVGHLGDLEPLWAGRLDDLLSGAPSLRPADLTNRATDEAEHDRADVEALLGRFRAARTGLVERLEDLGDADLLRTALHPRLEQPMSVVDLFYFVAEHDDHHLARISRLLRAAGGTPNR